MTAAKIAHEIASPLNSMFMAIQLLERDIKVKDQLSLAQVLGKLNDLKDDLQRLDRLVNELRCIGQPLNLNLGPVSLAEAVSDVLRQVLTKTVVELVDIQRRVPGDLPPVLADAVKLRQVLFNLTKNAVDAMPEGGTLTVRGYQMGKNICFEIADTGCGIPNEQKIFREFVSSKQEGTGLGLSIVKDIVKAHHGRIRYVSAPGHGAAFKVMLPRAAGYE